MRGTRQYNRRSMLGAVGAAAFLAACGGGEKQPETKAATPAASVPAAAAAQATTSASAAAASPADQAARAAWEQVVAAAKQEGKVSVNTFPGQGYAKALKGFQETYPEIKLELSNLRSVDFAPRLIQERKANVYTWDATVIPTSTALQVLKPEGAFDPIKPALTRPDIRDDKLWLGGFERGFALPADKQVCYSFAVARLAGMYYHADMVKLDELRSARDLLNPKWKGKIAITDPRSSGASFQPLTLARLKLGDDFLRQLIVEQQAVIVGAGGQTAEFLVRGRYPLAIGLDGTVLRDFVNQGIGKNVLSVRLPEMDGQSHTNVWLLNKAPHPNAAKVFVNWLLTKEAQAAWAKELETNSRRLDVEPGDRDNLVPPELASTLTTLDTEDFLPELVKTQDLAKQHIK